MRFCSRSEKSVLNGKIAYRENVFRIVEGFELLWKKLTNGVEDQASDPHHHIHREGVVEKLGQKLVLVTFDEDPTQGIEPLYTHFVAHFRVNSTNKGLKIRSLVRDIVPYP